MFLFDSKHSTSKDLKVSLWVMWKTRVLFYNGKCDVAKKSPEFVVNKVMEDFPYDLRRSLIITTSKRSHDNGVVPAKSRNVENGPKFCNVGVS